MPARDHISHQLRALTAGLEVAVFLAKNEKRLREDHYRATDAFSSMRLRRGRHPNSPIIPFTLSPIARLNGRVGQERLESQPPWDGDAVRASLNAAGCDGRDGPQ